LQGRKKKNKEEFKIEKDKRKNKEEEFKKKRIRKAAKE
jgi:hypothetical protein